LPHETPSQPREVRAPERPRRREGRRSQSSTLAAFELLAPPETIAGGAPLAEAPGDLQSSEQTEIARLRADLDRQTRELEALRARLETSPVGAPTASAQAPPPADRVRLDLAAATRLAEEAQLRERRTRAALESERAALEPAGFSTDRRTVATPTRPSRMADLPVSPSRGWTTLAVAKTRLPAAAGGEATGEETSLQRRTLHEPALVPVDPDRRLAEAEAVIASAHQQIDRLERELEQERRRRNDVEETLRRLRHALEPVEERRSPSSAGPRSQPAQENPTAAGLEDSPTRFEPLPGIPAADASASASTSGEPTRIEPVRPAVFELWRDAQIRRHLGPLGIDSLVDLIRLPLARRARSNGDPIRILLLGRGAWGEAAQLASGLVQREPHPFQLQVADPFDPDAVGARILGRESPLRDLIEPFPLPPTPAALASRLASLEPDLFVSSHFLSAQANPAAWLQTFEDLRARGHALIFAEHTGAPIPPRTSPIVEIGERIWARMPTRYTRRRDSDEPIPSWREAFEASAAVHANGCLGMLRDRFDFELLARFGHLAEPFIGSAVGSHFSVATPRDLRFLAQVADLDDRQIEAGTAPALHFVALVDPQIPTRSEWTG